jgi:hypothetical protein
VSNIDINLRNFSLFCCFVVKTTELDRFMDISFIQECQWRFHNDKYVLLSMRADSGWKGLRRKGWSMREVRGGRSFAG